MLKCLHCAGEYEAGPSTNSEDSTLEALLQAVTEEAARTGICGFDFMSGTHVNGAELESQQRHTSRENVMREAKEAVHSHIQANYEEDD